MIALLALKKLVSWVSLTLTFCDARSDSVRAISVTLRSTATADENSSTPKNSTSITGTITANSTAATPRLSRSSLSARRRMRSQIAIVGFIAQALVRFVLEGGGRGQQPLAAADICDVEAEPGDVKRPFVEQPHHDDVAGVAGEI